MASASRVRPGVTKAEPAGCAALPIWCGLWPAKRFSKPASNCDCLVSSGATAATKAFACDCPSVERRARSVCGISPIKSNKAPVTAVEPTAPAFSERKGRCALKFICSV